MGKLWDGFSDEVGRGAGRGANRLGGFFVAFLVWLISFKEGDQNRSWISKNFLRTSFLMLFAGLWIKSCGPLSNKEVSVNDDAKSDTKEISITVQLHKDRVVPVLPAASDFLPTSATGKSKEVMVYGITFLRFSGTGLIDIPAGRPLCALLPANTVAQFHSESPPRYVINMQEKTTAVVQVKHLSPILYLAFRMKGIKPEEYIPYSKADWEFLYEKYYAVKDQTFYATSSKRSPGAVVCF